MIQRVSKDSFTENPLFCIECLLETDRTGDSTLINLGKFAELVAQHFAGINDNVEKKLQAPKHLVSWLADEEMTLLRLQQHLENEKGKADMAINSLLQSFTLLCHQKKQEIFKTFDDQYLHLKANLAGYRSKVQKYFPEDSANREKFDQGTVTGKINNCNSTEDLELYVKHLKNEMLDTKVISEGGDQQKEIIINLERFADVIQDQINKFPTFPAFTDLEETTKKFEDLLKPFLKDFSKIDNMIYEISLGRLALIESKILKDPRDVEMLRKWISPKGKVQFRLLYQGSRDGFGAATFHQKCDNYNDTITLVKSKTYNKIFGGYSNETWNNASNYKTSNKSFIFSITEKQKYALKANMTTYSTYGYAPYGPTFGGGHDFMIADNCNVSTTNYSNFGHSYENGEVNGSYSQSKLAGAYNFLVEEIEVYHIDFDETFEETSSILKDVGFKQVKDWIAKGKKIELQRIYQATQDGFDASNFHTKCDGKGATLTVLKSQAFGNIFGGYTTVPWGQSGNFEKDPKSFLFSLDKGRKYPIISGDCAVMHSAESGPVFGAGYDLMICSNSNILAESTSALGLTFACDDPEPTLALAGSPEFMVEEIEVFMVRIK
eukprot:CAMPEP_0176421748 /NCGR_PEP_ID=MMETSP0127-20121128/9351_1 /TAXON_ID=938130 /ORGANISM="Platyophrya macrostoma, Strain WH" /LENGTH=605 /DNA_ID=CAMNT_0017802523 /DNA_START=84 /DNA_END=1901 /DNA_ORIENTATION=+